MNNMHPRKRHGLSKGTLNQKGLASFYIFLRQRSRVNKPHMNRENCKRKELYYELFI